MLYDNINLLEGSKINNATVASGSAFPSNPSVGLYVYTDTSTWIKTLVTGEGGSTLPDIVTPDTYKSVTVNAQGLVTAGSNPTTLAGYGITDALNKNGDALNGTLAAPTGSKFT